MGLIKKYQTGGAYDLLMNSTIEREGGNKQFYEDLMNKISHHESKYPVNKDGVTTYKYNDPSSKQVGGGPGRGLYMFEEGEDKGGITAVNRTYQYMKRNDLRIPEWLNKAYKYKTFDASSVGEYEQRMLFLGNYLEHEKADFNKLVTGAEDVKTFWGKYHQTQNDPKKLENFDKDLLEYEKTKVKRNSTLLNK